MRREPLSPSECHLSVCSGGVAFFGPVAGACISIHPASRLAVWRTKDWKYEVRDERGRKIFSLLAQPDPLAFSVRGMASITPEQVAA